MVITIHTHFQFMTLNQLLVEYINHHLFTRLSKQMLLLFVLSALDYMIITQILYQLLITIVT